MATKDQAYAVALDQLNSVWQAVSLASTAWAKAPKMAVRTATASVQTVINTAVREIRKVAVRDVLLNDIAVRLEGFKGDLITEGAAMNARELVQLWKRAVKAIVTDVAAQAPEVVSTPSFRAVQKSLAA